jgi:hypothetical protein
VQFNGLIYPSGFRLKVLSVRAPRKALVTVRCKGRGCPAKQRRKRIKQRPVRFQTFERFLRAGVRLEVFVTKPGTIGDYTRYAIRAGKAPKPAYGCVAASGKLRRIRCGS